jgi:hypothetical protein
MPRDNFPHAYVPHGVSATPNSIDECVRPCLRQAFPLPEDHADDRMFQHLLDALAQKTRPTSAGAKARAGLP